MQQGSVPTRYGFLVTNIEKVLCSASWLYTESHWVVLFAFVRFEQFFCPIMLYMFCCLLSHAWPRWQAVLLCLLLCCLNDFPVRPCYICFLVRYPMHDHDGKLCFLASSSAIVANSAAVDGGWSDYGTCSKTCGDGTKTRTCNNPAKANGGADCVGDATTTCNEGACPGMGFW